ncbi:MAG TPA: NAD(P)-dependent oxidoreductase [Acidimicrobiales bacterium]|nr:NAD(P)-dependent oxidoreductase [Acidimicrobiales bacterium]
MSTRKKVLIPTFLLHPDAEALLEDAEDVEVIYGLDAAERAIRLAGTERFKLREEAVKQALDRYLAEVHGLHAMGAGGHLPVTSDMLQRAERLEVVFISAAGTDRIDVGAATELGILVINAVGANAPSVAEHTVGLMLALCRRICDTDRFAHANKRVDAMRVMQTPPRLSLLGGKTLAIVGYGFVGRSIAQICMQGFGMEVIAFDPFFDPIEAKRQGVTILEDLHDALTAADFVSINTPFTAETASLIGAKELAAMKPTAFLINTARGGVVDTDALLTALTEGTLAGAALDVTDPEPLPPGHPLFDLDNVILTPHLGGNASEVFRDSSMTPVQLALEALRGRRPRHLVNPDAWPRHVERFGPGATASREP